MSSFTSHSCTLYIVLYIVYHHVFYINYIIYYNYCSQHKVIHFECTGVRYSEVWVQRSPHSWVGHSASHSNMWWLNFLTCTVDTSITVPTSEGSCRCPLHMSPQCPYRVWQRGGTLESLQLLNFYDAAFTSCRSRAVYPREILSVLGLWPGSALCSLLPLLGLLLLSSLQDIRAHSAAWKTDGVLSTEAGSRQENVRKNRYKDVLPCKSWLGMGVRPSRGVGAAPKVPTPWAVLVLARIPCVTTGLPDLASQSSAVAAFLPSSPWVHLGDIPARYTICPLLAFIQETIRALMSLSPPNSMFLIFPAGRWSDTSDPFPAPGRGTWWLHQWQLHQG